MGRRVTAIVVTNQSAKNKFDFTMHACMNALPMYMFLKVDWHKGTQPDMSHLYTGEVTVTLLNKPSGEKITTHVATTSFPQSNEKSRRVSGEKAP